MRWRVCTNCINDDHNKDGGHKHQTCYIYTYINQAPFHLSLSPFVLTFNALFDCVVSGSTTQY